MSNGLQKLLNRKTAAPDEKEYDWQQLLEDLSGENGADQAIFAAEMLDTFANEESRLDDLRRLALSNNLWISEVTAMKLAQLRGVKELRLLLKALENGFQLGHDCDGLQAAIACELEANPSEAVPVLLELMESENQIDRANAIWAYGHIASVASLEPLLNLVNDTSSEVRSAVAGSLPSFGADPRVTNTLIEMLNDDSEEVRISAAFSLGDTRDKRVVPILKEVAHQDRSENVREFAKYALKQFRRNKMLKLLFWLR